MTNTAAFALLIAGLLGLAVLFGGPSGGNQVSFAFKDLPSLPFGFSYQAWVIDHEDNWVNLGRFRRIGNAKNFSYVTDLHRQKQLVISLETGDPDGVGDLNGAAPDLILFAGKINRMEDVVHLTMISPDLETPSGADFFLRTPTDNDTHSVSKLKDGVEFNNFNDQQGIWFITIDQETGEPVPGLKLPRLTSNNFSFEGWVIHNTTDTYVSTGRFNDPTIPDRNSGQNPFDGGRVYLGPSNPGEDFVNPGIAVGPMELPINLNEGWYTTISIEPNSDGDDMPFVLKPWSTPIAASDTCLFATVTTQPNPKEYQGQKCHIRPAYDGVAVIH